MELKPKKTFLTIIILFFVGFIYMKYLTSNITHTSTASVVVIEKDIDESKRKYYMKVKNQHEPFQEFDIYIKEENIWNLVKVGNAYFVNVEWKNQMLVSSLFGEETNLLYIETIDK